MKYEYKHTEDFDGIVFPDFRAYGDRLVVFGAGVNGMLCAYALAERGADFACFVDSDEAKWGTVYCGHPVISPQQMRERHPDAPILLDMYTYRSIIDTLREWGYADIISPAAVFIGMDLDGAAAYATANARRSMGGADGYSLPARIEAGQVREWIDSYFMRGADFYREKHNFPKAINLDVTDRCTLRCRGCLGLKPHYHNRRPDMAWDDMSLVVDRLLSLRLFRRFHILGGEPLLYRDMDRLLDRLVADDGVDVINIITNATVLPDPALVPHLRDERIALRISQYGALSDKVDDIRALCAREGIRCLVMSQRWQDIGTVREPASDDEMRRAHRSCCQRNGEYIYVAHGRGYPCPFSANADALGVYAPVRDDYADLLAPSQDAAATREAIRRYYEKADPYTACRYCKGWTPFPEGKSIPVAEQFPGPVPDLPSWR